MFNKWSKVYFGGMNRVIFLNLHSHTITTPPVATSGNVVAKEKKIQNEGESRSNCPALVTCCVIELLRMLKTNGWRDFASFSTHTTPQEGHRGKRLKLAPNSSEKTVVV